MGCAGCDPIRRPDGLARDPVQSQELARDRQGAGNRNGAAERNDRGDQAAPTPLSTRLPRILCWLNASRNYHQTFCSFPPHGTGLSGAWRTPKMINRPVHLSIEHLSGPPLTGLYLYHRLYFIIVVIMDCIAMSAGEIEDKENCSQSNREQDIQSVDPDEGQLLWQLPLVGLTDVPLQPETSTETTRRGFVLKSCFGSDEDCTSIFVFNRRI